MANSNFVRIVLDTNVLISAALKPGGLEASLVAAALAGTVELCVTDQVWSEYEDVFARPKFHAVRDRARHMLDALRSAARSVAAAAPLTLALDDDDNRFLECALAAQAAFLVTGNLRHYPAECGTARMVNARVFAEATGLVS